MTILDEIKPDNHQRVMDLVEEVGFDISDWANFKGGMSKAASNPKYCYEWSFTNSNNLILINLWHSSMFLDGDTVSTNLNMRQFGLLMGSRGNRTLERRAATFDITLQKAISNHLSIRVITLEGDMRNIELLDPKPSHVHKRKLDPVSWAVTSYNWENGECLLTRGAEADLFADQFDENEINNNPERILRSSEVFNRDPKVRKKAMNRAGGNCELCGDKGFITNDGKIYLETHHVVPLSENGKDVISNVICLCPNHHREAHHGSNKIMIREKLLGILTDSINR